MKTKMKTKIINDTIHEFKVEELAGVSKDITRLLPKKEITLDFDLKATYREYVFHKLPRDIDNRSTIISSDDCLDFEEITVYETPSLAVEWRMSKERGRSRTNSAPNLARAISNTNITPVTRDFAAFLALREGVNSRMETIETSCKCLVKLSNQVKICPFQCEKLVQTYYDGTKQMKQTFFALSENDMWQLFDSKKLRQLVSSLDNLLSTFESLEDLLQACGSQLGKMGLVLSTPLPPPEKKTYSKFDVLIKELSWNLDAIHYALHLTTDIQFKWNENRCTYVLEKNHVTGVATEGVVQLAWKLGESEALLQKDRDHFSADLKNGSLLTPKKFFRSLAWQYFNLRSSTDRVRQYYAEILLRRLQENSALSTESSSVPDCFWINHMYLEIRNTLSGQNNTKAIYKGKWCGQVVAIAITNGTTRAAVEREALVMLKVQHPNIVDFFGCAFAHDAPQPKYSGSDDEPVAAGYLVMELMQEDLRRVIDRRARIQSGSPFPLPVTVDIFLQIAAAMIHMHSFDIIHRDLKSANFLVSPRSLKSNSQVPDMYIVKLTDFGNSKILDSDAAISNHTANSGTRRWMAPEVWGTPGVVLAPYTKSADVYSFGMICYEVITGLLPFHECIYNSQLQPLLHEGQRPLLPASVSLPDGLKELISKCWDQEPSARPNFKEIEKALWTIKYELELQ